MNDYPSDETLVIDAIDDIGSRDEIEAQWAILGRATDEQIFKAISQLPRMHVVILIRRLIERAYLNEQ